MNRIESVLLSGYFSWGFLDEWEFLVGYFMFFFFRNFSLLFIHYFLPLLLSQVFVFLLSQVFAFLGEESVEVMVYIFLFLGFASGFTSTTLRIHCGSSSWSSWSISITGRF
uniref:Uncharacterized protein n=1 Tax=Cacopsylla melanoneura TaxID=428564 RepID=A0A8D9E6B8_9HEMI